MCERGTELTEKCHKIVRQHKRPVWVGNWSVSAAAAAGGGASCGRSPSHHDCAPFQRSAGGLCFGCGSMPCLKPALARRVEGLLPFWSGSADAGQGFGGQIPRLPEHSVGRILRYFHILQRSPVGIPTDDDLRIISQKTTCAAILVLDISSWKIKSKIV